MDGCVPLRTAMPACSDILQVGCIECKAKMADHLIEWITPVQERTVE